MLINHMENHRLVLFVKLVMMAPPVRASAVDFDTPHPTHPIDRYHCLEKVRSGIIVMITRKNDVKLLTLGRFRFQKIEMAMLPYIV